MKKAAIVGLGWWGAHIIRQLRDSTILRITMAIGSRGAHQSVADEYGLAFSTDLNQALKDPDIDFVILATPHALHVQQIEAVARSGKHVFCEKPLALEVHEARKAIEACRTAGVLLGIGHERRFEPSMEEFRALLAAKELGAVMHAEASFSHDKLRNLANDNWRVPPEGEAPMALTGTGIHMTDAFIDLLGPITEVNAFSTSRVAFPSSGDVLSAHLRFSSGATAYINTILVTPYFSRMAIFGSEAWAEVRNSTHPDEPGSSTFTLQRRDGTCTIRELPWKDAVRANLETFALSIDGRAVYPFSDAQLIGNIAVVEAITRSIATNRGVSIDIA